MLNKFIRVLKKDVVLSAAAALAVISCFVVPPDGKYLSYIDWNTLILLFCLMLIVGGLRAEGVFETIGHKLLGRVHTARGVALTLVGLCFFSSMFITNDVALITFVPFGIFLLETAGLSGSLCLAVTLMTIAGNLGSMLTPMGNPQNLYLYSISGLGLGEFLLLLLPYGVTAAVLLTIATVVRYRSRPVSVPKKELSPLRMRFVWIYLALFVLCLLSVAGVVTKPVVLVVVSIAILLLNRRLFCRVDYALLLTFVCFFVFVGNIKRLEELQVFLSGALSGRELPLSVLISQVISNVPAAILLSNYTENLRALLVGTNLGGLGTLIASMASLISYKQIAAKDPALKSRYLKVFTLWNVGFLIVLYAISCLLQAV